MTCRFEPCPFCGRRTHLSIKDAGGIDLTEDEMFCGEMPTWQVYCGYCGACGPEVIAKKDKAIEAWNSRVKLLIGDEGREVEDESGR